MKNRNIGLLYSGIDGFCIILVFVWIHLSLSRGSSESILFLNIPYTANLPAMLPISPWLITTVSDTVPWIPFSIGAAFGCIQYYFIGWFLGWLLEIRKHIRKFYWNRILLGVLILWSVLMALRLSLCLAAGCLIPFMIFQ